MSLFKICLSREIYWAVRMTCGEWRKSLQADCRPMLLSGTGADWSWSVSCFLSFFFSLFCFASSRRLRGLKLCDFGNLDKAISCRPEKQSNFPRENRDPMKATWLLHYKTDAHEKADKNTTPRFYKHGMNDTLKPVFHQEYFQISLRNKINKERGKRE